MINYQTFYRKFGIRQLQQLLGPHFFDLAFFELPQESLFHYIDYDGLSLGPAMDEVAFRHQKHTIQMQSVSLLEEQLGHPRHAGANLPSQLKDFFSRHRRMRPILDISKMSDKQAVAVLNYAPLSKTYHYQANVFTPYWKWRNIFATVTKTIARVTQASQRQHFLFVASPKVIPSFHQLEQATLQKLDATSLKPFRDVNAYILLELWKWLTQEPDTSLWHDIPRNKIHLVNLVFLESGKWCVLNLGFLNSFRNHQPEDFEGENGYVIASKSKITGVQVAKRLLRLYMSTMELRTLTAKSDTSNFDASELDDKALIKAPGDDAATLDEDDEDDVSTITPSVSEVDTADIARQVNTVSKELDFDHHQDLEDLEPEAFQAFIAEQDRVIDADLKQLEEIVKKQAEAAAAKRHALIEEVVLAPAPAAPEHPIHQLIDALASDGALSAAEHRRFERLSQNYKTLPAPVGEGTLEEYIDIAPTLLALPEKPETMVDSPSVLDKSMLHSSLNEFDSRYVKHVLGRDIANMVMGLQKAGVAVVNYKVERRANILGAYEDHMVKVSPVVGAASTLRFKTPVIDEDGTFTSNGHQYRVRKQRSDLPIRKTDKNRVALSTYYGRTFITRGRSLANDYGHWLCSQLQQKVLSVTEGGAFQEPVLADVFEQHLRSPRSYAAISSVLKEVRFKGFHLNFSHQEVIKTYPPEVVKYFETNGQLLFGTDLGHYLYLDKLGHVWQATMPAPPSTEEEEAVPEGPQDLGLLEAFFDIDTQDAPVEYTSVNVWGKSVPVGILLGLEMGLHNLVELLRVQPRVVPAGEKGKVILPSEWSLTFSDETWIFPRSQKLAALILGGFTEFAKSLKSFSVYSFDQRGVYVNLLEANGLGSRYIREIDLMYQMFVDPISLEILKEMKEPTTFKGLLFRASQMLINDQHLDDLDMSLSRIKGYERVAGAVYAQFVQSLRNHNGRLGKQSAPIELNPYAVWKSITEDSAKDQIKQINPIKAIREQEAVVFSGEGGRSKRSMTRDTRAYHPNDMGVISESTVDNSDVALNTYMSANPQLTSLRGLTRRYDIKKHGIASLLSTAAQLAPGSGHDDHKRGALPRGPALPVGR